MPRHSACAALHGLAEVHVGRTQGAALETDDGCTPFQGRDLRRGVTPTDVDDINLEAASLFVDPSEVQYYELAPDIRIAYEVRGSSGPVVVLLHGFGASRESWYDVAPLLQDEMQLYLIDLLGFGLSSKPARADYSVAMQATIVAKFITSLHLSDVTLIGHSYGGGVALRTYLDHEGLPLIRLVLIDAAGYEQPLPFFVGTLRTPLLNRIVLRLPARTRARITLRRLFANRNRVTADRVTRYAKYFDLPGAHAAFVAAARHLIPTDHGEVISRIASISIPTLIVWGDRDAAIKPQNARNFARDIAGSRLVIIKNCGHIPHEEWPVETAGALREFIVASHE